jgi:hypothetical protein
MSWSTIDGGMSCSTTSLRSVSAICPNWCGSALQACSSATPAAGTLVNDERASASSCTMMRMLLSLSHSSSASTTTMYGSSSCSFDSGLMEKLDGAFPHEARDSSFGRRVSAIYDWTLIEPQAATPSVAVMRRSRSRACVLVLLPHLLSTSYLSCIIDTSCKQTLLLAFQRTARAQQHNRTIHNTLFLTVFHTATPRLGQDAHPPQQ